MNYKFLNFKLIFFLAAFFGIFGLAKGSWAATNNLADCAQATVAAAINSAAPGDTLICPAGNWPWNSAITISKNIILKGTTTGCPRACIAGTTIVRGSNNNLINVASSGDLSVDISGFTFDSNGGSNNIILAYNSSTITPLYNLRIHHNELKNDTGGIAFQVGLDGGGTGLVFGLLDHNKFTNNSYMFKVWGAGAAEWAAFPSIDNGGGTGGGALLNAGTRNYMYLEDNISSGTQVFLGSSGTGARWVFRHNTVSSTGGYQTLCLDAHGDTLNRGVVGFEAYENVFSGAESQGFAYRGGAGIIFNNKWNVPGGTWSGRIEVNEDSPSCVCSNSGGCAGGYGSAGDGVYNGYIWNNLNDISGTRIAVNPNDPCGTIIEKQTYWRDTNDSNPPADTGYFVKGLSSNRYASACTAQNVNNVYWETDTQKLYRCTSANTWTLVYTPYTYPHPLQGSTPPSDTTAPVAPSGLSVQ